MSLSTTSKRFLNTSRDGDSTTSLGSLSQCLTTLSVKKFFPISNLNLPRHNFRPFPLVLKSPPRSLPFSAERVLSRAGPPPSGGTERRPRTQQRAGPGRAPPAAPPRSDIRRRWGGAGTEAGPAVAPRSPVSLPGPAGPAAGRRMPLGLKPTCSVCRSTSSSMWKKGGQGEILCNNCTARSAPPGPAAFATTSAAAQHSNGGGGGGGGKQVSAGLRAGRLRRRSRRVYPSVPPPRASRRSTGGPRG